MVSRGEGRGGLGPLAEEASLAIILRGQSWVRLMCTPRDLDELAVGYLFSRGMIRTREDLASLYLCPDRGSVLVDVHGDFPAERGPERYVSSACGGGFGGLEEPPPLAVPPWSAGEALPLTTLSASMRRMFETAVLHGRTGGVHCSALLLESGELLVREDVGRHNAVDKVLGRLLLDGRGGQGRALLTSGRIAFDMVHKAAMAGIGLVVSRSIPTTSAYELALGAGITLVGRILSPRPSVYGSDERVS